jgi:hypothetical protein
MFYTALYQIMSVCGYIFSHGPTSLQTNKIIIWKELFSGNFLSQLAPFWLGMSLYQAHTKSDLTIPNLE